MTVQIGDFGEGDGEYIFMNRLVVCAAGAWHRAAFVNWGDRVKRRHPSIDRARSRASNRTALIADGMLHRIFIGYGLNVESNATLILLQKFGERKSEK